MSKSGSSPPEDQRKPPDTEENTTGEGTPAASGKRSAMRLPEGVGPNASQRPNPRKPWERFQGGRPQQDFARRAGKDRKVH